MSLRMRAISDAFVHLATNAVAGRMRGSTQEQRSPALRKAAAGRWPADVYNLALIAGPGEE